MQGLYGFRQEFGFYPESNNREHMDQMLALVRKFCDMVWCFLPRFFSYRVVVAHSEVSICDLAVPQNAQVSELHSSTSNSGKEAKPELDESVARHLLCCPASEFQPLSALIAGYAAIHVMKFAGVYLLGSCSF